MERPWNLEKRPSGFDQSSKRIRSGSSGGDEENGRILAEAECGQSRICRWHDAERVRRDDLHPLYPGEAGVHQKGIAQIRSLRASGASWRTISHELGIGAGNTLQGGSAAFRKPSTDAVGKWLIPDSWVSRKNSSRNTCLWKRDSMGGAAAKPGNKKRKITPGSLRMHWPVYGLRPTARCWK